MCVFNTWKATVTVCHLCVCVTCSLMVECMCVRAHSHTDAEDMYQEKAPGDFNLGPRHVKSRVNMHKYLHKYAHAFTKRCRGLRSESGHPGC